MKILNYIERLENHIEFISPSGDGYIDEYEFKKDEKGFDELVKTGRRNTQEEIQSFAESANITNIINRFMNGEIELLHAVDGDYVDVRDAPTSYADYFAKVKEAEKIFEQLPDEIKDKFDNDAEKFFLEFGTDTFNDKVNDNNNIIEPMEVIKEDFDNAE